MTKARRAALLAAATLASACTLENGNFTNSYVAPPAKPADAAPVAPSQVALSNGPAKGPHTVIGPVQVSVNKLTAFHPNPTPELARAELQKKAAAVGANAVVNLEITGPHVSLMSWGTVDAKGIAVRY